MANLLFNAGREGFLLGEIDWDTATIKISLLDGYTYNAAHKFMSEVLAGAGVVLVATQTLTAKTGVAGVADAADPVFTAVPTGPAIEHLIIYQSSAVGGGADVATTSQRVIALIDTATGLPITPNGGDLTIAFDNGVNKIFKL